MGGGLIDILRKTGGGEIDNVIRDTGGGGINGSTISGGLTFIARM